MTIHNAFGSSIASSNELQGDVFSKPPGYNTARHRNGHTLVRLFRPRVLSVAHSVRIFAVLVLRQSHLAVTVVHLVPRSRPFVTCGHQPQPRLDHP